MWIYYYKCNNSKVYPCKRHSEYDVNERKGVLADKVPVQSSCAQCITAHSLFPHLTWTLTTTTKNCMRLLLFLFYNQLQYKKNQNNIPKEIKTQKLLSDSYYKSISFVVNSPKTVWLRTTTQFNLNVSSGNSRSTFSMSFQLGRITNSMEQYLLSSSWWSNGVLTRTATSTSTNTPEQGIAFKSTEPSQKTDLRDAVRFMVQYLPASSENSKS